jgi:hypothetical protein
MLSFIEHGIWSGPPADPLQASRWGKGKESLISVPFRAFGGGSPPLNDPMEVARMVLRSLPTPILMALMVGLTCFVAVLAARAKSSRGGEDASKTLDLVFAGVYNACAVLVAGGLGAVFWFFLGFNSIPWLPIVGLALSCVGVWVSVTVESFMRRLDTPEFVQREQTPEGTMRRAIFLHGVMGATLSFVIFAIGGARRAGQDGVRPWPPGSPFDVDDEEGEEEGAEEEGAKAENGGVSKESKEGANAEDGGVSKESKEGAKAEDGGESKESKEGAKAENGGESKESKEGAKTEDGGAAQMTTNNAQKTQEDKKAEALARIKQVEEESRRNPTWVGKADFDKNNVQKPAVDGKLGFGTWASTPGKQDANPPNKVVKKPSALGMAWNTIFK